MNSGGDSTWKSASVALSAIIGQSSDSEAIRKRHRSSGQLFDGGPPADALPGHLCRSVDDHLDDVSARHAADAVSDKLGRVDGRQLA